MDTLALTTDGTWDMTLDLYGNLATFGDATPGDTTGPGIRMAQDAATQCLTFRGELYYDTTQGVRYDQILGMTPNMVFITSEFQSQALLTEGVETALPSLTFSGNQDRKLTGTIYVSDANGNSGMVNL